MVTFEIPCRVLPHIVDAYACFAILILTHHRHVFASYVLDKLLFCFTPLCLPLSIGMAVVYHNVPSQVHVYNNNVYYMAFWKVFGCLGYVHLLCRANPALNSSVLCVICVKLITVLFSLLCVLHLLNSLSFCSILCIMLSIYFLICLSITHRFSLFWGLFCSIYCVLYLGLTFITHYACRTMTQNK